MLQRICHVTNSIQSILQVQCCILQQRMLLLVRMLIVFRRLLSLMFTTGQIQVRPIT